METNYKCGCKKINSIVELFDEIENNVYDKPLMIWFRSNTIVDSFKRDLLSKKNDIYTIVAPNDIIPQNKTLLCHRYLDQMNIEMLEFCIDLSKKEKTQIIYFANEYERGKCPDFVSWEFNQVDLTVE